MALRDMSDTLKPFLPGMVIGYILRLVYIRLPYSIAIYCMTTIVSRPIVIFPRTAPLLTGRDGSFKIVLVSVRPAITPFSPKPLTSTWPALAMRFPRIELHHPHPPVELNRRTSRFSMPSHFVEKARTDFHLVGRDHFQHPGEWWWPYRHAEFGYDRKRCEYAD